MQPAGHSKSSSEMQTAYYILVVPGTLKTLSSFSLFGLLIVMPLYYRARLYKPATLHFDDINLVIAGEKISIDIPRRLIKKVYLNDLKNAFGRPKEKLQVIIQQNAYKNTTFRLENYERGGELINALSTLENVEIVAYEMEMVSDHSEDE